MSGRGTTLFPRAFNIGKLMGAEWPCIDNSICCAGRLGRAASGRVRGSRAAATGEDVGGMVFGRRHRAVRLLAASCVLVGMTALDLPRTQAGPTALARPAAHGGLGHGRLGHGRLRTVRYLGYRFRVPVSWLVVYDERDRRGCVRFDQHVLYLGAVSGDEFCPSWLLGTTEALLVEPGQRRSASSSTENAVARQVTVHAPRIVITATFDADPAVIFQILASARLPAPRLVPPDPARSGSELARKVAPLTSAIRPLPASVASYKGLGFDTCTAPSRTYMRAWRRWSPYRAVGIYIGGADRACAQPNLSRRWVRAEARAGWRFIPLYAGPQAAFGEIRAPLRQGHEAALDAVAQARHLGFGPHTPLYYDMEAYLPMSRVRVLRFLSAWTRTLHRLHFASGVYSSSDSAVADLARHYPKGRYAKPNIIYDALWNGRRTTWDRNLPASQWARHKRIHQFMGDVTQTYGGDTLNIDKDYLNVRVGTHRVRRR